MSYEKYEKLCILLKKCLEYYEQLRTKDFTFYYNIASGDNLLFKINENRIAHLLGVNTDLIKIANPLLETKKMSSFELLRYMLDDYYRFYGYFIKKNIAFNLLFSPMIEEKIKVFETNIRYGLLAVAATIKIDKSKNWQDDLPEAIDVDYLIIKEMEDDYAVLGLRKDKDFRYIPVSNMCWNKNNLDKYMKYLQKQECSFPTTLFIKEINKKMWLNAEEKNLRLRLLRQWSNQFDMSIVVSRDYERVLLNNRDKILEKERNNAFLEEITDSVGRNAFPISTDYDDFYIKKLCYAINNSHFKAGVDDELTYSELKEELNSLQAENKELIKSDSEKTAEIQKLRMELNAHKALYENMKQCLTSFEESSKEVLVKKRQS